MEQAKMQESNAEPPVEQPPDNCQLPNQCPPVSALGQPQGRPQPQPYQLPPYQPPLGPQPYAQQPYNKQPYTQQPYTQQPYSQQQFAGAAATAAVVTSQPIYSIAPVLPQMVPDNHAGLAWFTCLCCFWPLGIPAIVKSCEVDNAVREGDINRAREASQSSRCFSCWALGIGLTSYIISIITLIIMLVRFGSLINM